MPNPPEQPIPTKVLGFENSLILDLYLKLQSSPSVLKLGRAETLNTDSLYPYKKNVPYLHIWSEGWEMIFDQFEIVMGLGQNILTRVGLDQPLMVWVGIWKISPKNVKFFNFFPFGSKKISSGQVGKYPGQRPLIYCGSKVSSGRGPLLVWNVYKLTSSLNQHLVSHWSHFRCSNHLI